MSEYQELVDNERRWKKFCEWWENFSKNYAEICSVNDKVLLEEINAKIKELKK